MHGQQKPIGHILQIRIACARLHPMRRQVQVVDRAVDIVDIALGQHRAARDAPFLDDGGFIIAERALAMGPDIAVADIDDGDLFHLDPALPVIGRDAKHRGAVFADAEVILR